MNSLHTCSAVPVTIIWVVACAVGTASGAGEADGPALQHVQNVVKALDTASPGQVSSDLFERLPTRFRYGSRDCWERFGNWDRTVLPVEQKPGGMQHRFAWTDPQTRFRATLTLTIVENPPALEIQWEFENGGKEPSELITDLASIALSAPAEPNQCVLWSCNGGTSVHVGQAADVGFAVSSDPLGEKTLSVVGGRSSAGKLPIVYLEHFCDDWGLVAALGWSGQWQAKGHYDAEAKRVRFDAGMQPVHFRLPAGQRVRLPSAVLVPFRGDQAVGQNTWRRLLRTRYQGRLGGQMVLPPVSFNSWFVFNNNVNERMLCELADQAAPLGIKYFCLDAGWFDGDFPVGVGNWTVNKTKFPNGLKAVADHVHKLGMKFGLWFEPERLGAECRWKREHPELVWGDVLDLSNPQAVELILNMMSDYIRTVGVDWIRYDFNTNPLGAWANVEGNEEQGLKQIQYINGLYALLDELMRRHPSLLIEQCASGGMRIDLETIRRGHTYWKSDQTFDQQLMRFHETGGNQFLLAGHLNTNYCQYRSPGELVGLFAGPLGFGVDLRTLNSQQKDDIRNAVAAYKQVRMFLNEDYYPLFPQDLTGQTWAGWQFVDPARQAGFFGVYRSASSPYPSAIIRLRGLDDSRTYELNELLTGRTLSKTGAQLAAGIELDLAGDASEVWKCSAQR